MRRLLVVPAAGAGSRLKADIPKLLVPVAGRPMIDHVLDLHGSYVDEVILIVQPSAEPIVRRHCARRSERIHLHVQSSPTGMLDALLIPHAAIAERAPDAIWITWCDQVAVHPDTAAQLAATQQQRPDAAVVMPTVRRQEPYIHLVRDADQRIVRVLQRREGDPMPAEGEADSGLFALSAEAYLRLLPEYAQTLETAAVTGERNFVPFIGWLRDRANVVTFPAREPIECVGVNTPDELRAVEAHLLARAGR